jgi:DNA repair exonuclease SbcCD ATPase subunit
MEKKIILKSLTLSHWRGQNHTVDFSDVTTISGRNGSGKSSLMKAFYWLLTGFPSPTETKNFNLFDNRLPITPETPKACVKAVLNIEGFDYVIERKAEAKFTRKRGSSEMVKDSSDTYELYIDNIETSATNFSKWVNDNICPIEQIVYCLDGGFFTELLAGDKSKARKVLETIVGEITPEDMKGDYSIIAEDMKRFTVDSIMERTKAELKPWRERLAEIPAIIDSKEATLAEYMAIDFDAILGEINKAKEDIEDLDASILGKGKEIEPIMGERNRILNLVNEKVVVMNNAKRAHDEKESSKLDEVKRSIASLKTDNAAIQSRNAQNKHHYDSAVICLEQKKKYLALLENTRETLLKERDEVKARVFVEETCAYCGQELPFDKMEEARAKFNEKKTSELNNIVAKGRSNNEAIEATKADIEMLTILVEKGYEEEPLKSLSDLEAEYAKLLSSVVYFEATDEYARMRDEIERLEATMPEIPSNDTSALTSAKKVLMDTLEGLNRRYGLKTKADEIRKEIATLRMELRSVGSEIARLEGKIDKCKEYIQEKADVISFRVNGELHDCVIDMWSTQKDGTLVPDTVLRGKDGVRFGSLNFAQQIKSKIELQMLFLRHFGISLPLWVDEATVFDSSNKPSFDNQAIFLYASDSPFLVVDNGKQ